MYTCIYRIHINLSKRTSAIASSVAMVTPRIPWRESVSSGQRSATAVAAASVSSSTHERMRWRRLGQCSASASTAASVISLSPVRSSRVSEAPAVRASATTGGSCSCESA